MTAIEQAFPKGGFVVRSEADIGRLMAAVRSSAKRAQTWIASHQGDPLDLLRRMKFEPVGFHPLEDRPLNLVEQINQTWTFAVALEATRQLMKLHPDMPGWHLAPGAHAALELDIMSEEPGYAGAETFAAVTPRNNGKLAADLAKLATRPERFRYVFFHVADLPGQRAVAAVRARRRPGVVRRRELSADVAGALA